MSRSISRIPIKIIIEGIGEAKGELNRLTAPLTVEEILKILPIKTRITPSTEGVMILLGIRRGEEKSVTQVRAGAIVYWPRQDAMVIYPKNAIPYSPVNRLGYVTEGLEVFQDIRGGKSIVIEFDQS